MSDSTAQGYLSEDVRQKISDIGIITTAILSSAGIATLLGHVALRTLTEKSLVKILFGWGSDNDRHQVYQDIENAGNEELTVLEEAMCRALHLNPDSPGAQDISSAVQRCRAASPAASQHKSHHSSRNGGSQFGQSCDDSQSGQYDGSQSGQYGGSQFGWYDGGGRGRGYHNN